MLERLTYLLGSQPYRLEKPKVLQFPVTDICNSRCQMCYIWKNKARAFVTPEDIREKLTNSLFSEVRSVGLNGGEPTLRNDLGLLAESLFEALPKLRSISLITNAFRAEEVISRISDVGEVVARNRGALDVMVSLDGYGEVHDRVRGKPGNFERATAVIEYAKMADLVTSFRIGCTVIKENVYGVHDLLDFCKDRDVYIKYRLGIPHKRLYTRDIVSPFSLDMLEKYHLAEFLEGLISGYERNVQQKYFYRSLIDQILFNAPRKAGCDWQHRGATLTADGEILFCAVESDKIATLRDPDIEARYFGAEEHLKEIVRSKCADCNHDYVGLPPRAVQLRHLGLQVLSRFGLTDAARIVFYRSGLKGARDRRALRATKHRRVAYEGLVNEPACGRPILVCGWYGTETLGDKAILAEIVSSLATVRPGTPVKVASLNPYVSEITRSQMPELADVQVVTVEQATALAQSCEMVVFGGGPLMALTPLGDMLAIFRAAAQGGRPRLVAGCGVGPLGARYHNRAIREILRLATIRIYRDEQSKAAAISLGVDAGSDTVADDPAFSWIAKRRKLGGRRSAGPPALVLGLRSFPWRQYARGYSMAQGEKTRRDTDRAIIEALRFVAARCPDVVIRPLPMCTNHFGDDDRWYYRGLFREAGDISERIDRSLLERELSPDRYLEIFNEADAVLAMRYHSLVFALGCGVPVAAIDYTLGRGKVASLAQSRSVSVHTVDELDAEVLACDLTTLLSRSAPVPEIRTPIFSGYFTDRIAKLMANA